MNHINAPATALVATHCCACHHELTDAVSVEIGMGPTCRRKAGLETEGTGADWSRALPLLAVCGIVVDAGDARRAANVAVHRIAADQSSAHVPAILSALEALGFARVAERIRDHLRPAAVRVDVDGDRFVVRVEGLDRESFDALLTAMRAVPGRRYDSERKASLVPASSRIALWNAIRGSVRAGTIIVWPRGIAAA